MAKHAEGTMDIGDWKEEPYVELDGGRKLTLTDVAQTIHGDIEGEGSARWLTAFQADGTAEYVGYQRVVGTVGGAKGTVVLRMVGEYDGNEARMDWLVVPGSGTGGLEGMTGSGCSSAPAGGSPVYSLD